MAIDKVVAIDKINEWATWWWANAKIDRKKFCITETNCKYFEGGYGRLQLGDVYTCHGFLQRTCKFEEAYSKIFFHKFIQRFVDKRIGNQLSTKFMKPQKQLYVILGRQA